MVGLDVSLLAIGSVIHMLRPPRDLFAPSTMLRVLRAQLAPAPPPLQIDDLALAHADLAA